MFCRSEENQGYEQHHVDRHENLEAGGGRVPHGNPLDPVTARERGQQEDDQAEPQQGAGHQEAEGDVNHPFFGVFDLKRKRLC